jgi:peptide/nickel transport system permease protein
LLNYVIRRLLIALPSLIGISIVLFTVLALAPGDPFEELATNPNVPPEVRLALRAQFGLDDPVWQRYISWFTSMLQGNWGFSFQSRIDVDQLIMQRLPTTIAVIGFSQLLAIAIALPVGILAAVKPYSACLYRILTADVLHRHHFHSLLQHLSRLAAVRLSK